MWPSFYTQFNTLCELKTINLTNYIKTAVDIRVNAVSNISGLHFEIISLKISTIVKLVFRWIEWEQAQICISVRLSDERLKFKNAISPKLNKLQSWISVRWIQRGLLYKMTLISNRSKGYSSSKILWNFFRDRRQNIRDLRKNYKKLQISFDLMNPYVKKHAESNGRKRKAATLLV